MNPRLYSGLLPRVLLVVAGLLLAGQPGRAEPRAGAVVVPNFWDVRQRPPKPALAPGRTIRFLTDQDYPPFDFLGPEGQLTGFNIDLARAVCDALKIVCTIQPRRWDTLVAALDDNQGDAIIASLAISAESRKHMAFTRPYYRTPARFAARKDHPLSAVTPAGLKGMTVAVVARSAHEAYLHLFFPDAVVRAYPDSDAARQALRNGEAEALFGDGVGMAIWLNGDSGDCCAFAGGPYLESRFFGYGVGIAVRRGDDQLRRALDYGLLRVWEQGAYADLYLKYFPVGFF